MSRNAYTREVPVLSDKERNELEGWARRHKTGQALASRARIILASAEGQNDIEVAAQLGTTRETVGKWRRRFLKDRCDALMDAPRPGAPRTITDEDVELLKAVADQAAVAINKAQLWEMAVTDSLTGLYVRRYFMVKLQEEIHRAERYNKIVSVIMADLDGFKNINDTYGHDAGDRALKIISRFLQKNIRDKYRTQPEVKSTPTKMQSSWGKGKFVTHVSFDISFQ